MSSVTEGLGTSLLDAMAAGKPTSARAPAAFPRSSTTARPGCSCRRAIRRRWRSAIVRLLQDEPLRQRMGAAGLARAAEQFTVERMVEATLAVYGRIPPRS